MTKLKQILLTSTFLLIALGFTLIFRPQAVTNLGSVSFGSEYQSTTTSQTFAVAPAFKLLVDGSGTLGSLIVTTTGTGVINIYDATTTTNGAIYGTTTLAKLTTSAAGTYTFDTVFNTGLLIETVGTNTGSTTITYRAR